MMFPSGVPVRVVDGVTFCDRRRPSHTSLKQMLRGSSYDEILPHLPCPRDPLVVPCPVALPAATVHDCSADEHSIPQFIPSTVGIIPAIVALLIPRILILFWIYQDQGITIWFLLHVIALLCAWAKTAAPSTAAAASEVIE